MHYITNNNIKQNYYIELFGCFSTSFQSYVMGSFWVIWGHHMYMATWGHVHEMKLFEES